MGIRNIDSAGCSSKDDVISIDLIESEISTSKGEVLFKHELDEGV